LKHRRSAVFAPAILMRRGDVVFTMKKRRLFTQADVTRIVKAVVKAGLAVARVEISLEGSVVVIPTTGFDTGAGDDLDRELAEFEARKK